MQYLLIISMLAFLCLGGCDSGDKAEPQKLTRIGILLFGDSRQPQVDGFKDGLAELGYQVNTDIEYLVKNAQNDRKSIAPLVSELISKKCDLLVASGGLEADAMKKLAGPVNIPVVVSYVNAIVERNLVDERSKPGWNVTGVDNLNAELSGKRVELIHDLLPQVKKILILYYEKIAPSRIGVEKAKLAAKNLGLEIDARAVASRQDIQAQMSTLVRDEVDAMLTVPTAPIDNALKDLILPVTNKLKLPLMTHSRPLAEAGALASYGANFYDLGVQAARLADKVIKGVSADRIPFEAPKKYTYTINKSVLDSLLIPLTELTKAQVDEFVNE